MGINLSFDDGKGVAETPGRKEDCERTPLLAHHDDNPEANHPAAMRHQLLLSEQKSKCTSVRQLSNWLLKHYMTFALSCLSVGGIVAIVVYIGVSNLKEPSHSSAAICLTPACVLAAAELLQDISPRYHEIDPCTSFDRYVCEGWEERHDLRADQGSSFTGTLMAEKSQQILRHLLESPYTDNHQFVELSSSTEKLLFEKIQDAYDACMDEGRIKDLGSGPLIEILRKVDRLFPAENPQETLATFEGLHDRPPKIEGAYKGKNKLSNTVAYLESIGITALVSFDIDPDDKDPDSTILLLNPPRQPGLPSKQYYQNEQVVKDYSRTIGQVLEALLHEANPSFPTFTDQSFLRSEDLVKSIVDFESRLALITPDSEDIDDVTKYYNPCSLEEADSLIPQLSISNIVSSLSPKGYTPTKVIIGSPTYLTTLSKFLQDTTKETLKAYLVWKTVQTFAYAVQDDAVKPLLRFNNQLQGKDPDAVEERWRTCVGLVDDGLGWILSRFFVEKAFSENAKNFGDDIVSGIKEQFIKKLNAAAWMSKDVRKLGIEKVHNIVQKIGFPIKSPDLRNASTLQEYYEAVNISRTGFFDNLISVAKFSAHREWSALGKPTDRNEWDMTVPTVNAYYNPAGNEIVFPAGIMQAPVFYNPSVPIYLSYGGFGSVSGHELSHAFDSTGRHYDETGNFTDWWDNATVQSFESKAQCFIDQFHEFTIPGPDKTNLHVNGRLTLGENIADAGGLSASYAAWKQLEKIKPSELLPGFQNFTKDQLFFISYANWWCGKDREASAIKKIYQDPHSPTWARILGTMANSREFKQSFHCPIKEPRCELW